MPIFRKALVAITALAACFVAMPSASAVVPTYPDATDVQITLTLNASTLIGGANLTIKAVAKSGGKNIPGRLTVEAFGKTHTDNDNSLKITVKTPVVTQREVRKVTATFVPTDNADASASTQGNTVTAYYSTASASAVVPAAYRTAHASRNVTLLPRGSGDITPNSLLPNTGGASLWYLIVGALLLASGAALVTAVRRRSKNSV